MTLSSENLSNRDFLYVVTVPLQQKLFYVVIFQSQRINQVKASLLPVFVRCVLYNSNITRSIVTLIRNILTFLITLHCIGAMYSANSLLTD